MTGERDPLSVQQAAAELQDFIRTGEGKVVVTPGALPESVEVGIDDPRPLRKIIQTAAENKGNPAMREVDHIIGSVAVDSANATETSSE